MIIHKVVKNDSLYRIAQKYGVSLSKIIEDNNIKNPDKLIIGQELYIPKAAATHTVRGGDTLDGISNDMQTSKQTLYRLNPSLYGQDNIYPGQILNTSYQSPTMGAISVSGFATPKITERNLRATLPYLTYISVYSHRFDVNGNIVCDFNQDEIISLAESYSAIPLMTLTNTDSSGNYSADMFSSITGTNAKNNIDKITEYAKQHGYRVVHIDFELLPADSSEQYEEFLIFLRGSLRAENIALFVSVAPRYDNDSQNLYTPIDYGRLCSICDLVYLMSYEISRDGNTPSPTATAVDMERALRYITLKCPASKISLGIPNYAYEYDKNGAYPITDEYAMNLALRKNAAIETDMRYDTPYFSYNEGVIGNTNTHTVHTDNYTSFAEKMSLVYDFGIMGINIYPIDNFNPKIYFPLIRMYNIMKR